MALVSNSKYGTAVELAAGSAPSTDVGLYAKDGGGDNAHLVLQAHTASFTGDVHVTGTLHVEGTINSVNRNETNLVVEDKTITVASGSAAAATDGAGLVFGGSNSVTSPATILYDNANSAIDFTIGGTTELRLQDGILRPETDNDVDLGASGAEFKDLYLDGTANIDSLVADTADINGGTVDGITSLTAGGDLDIGAHDFRAATLTADTMTATRVAFYGANGVLSGDSDMTFATDTLTVTKLGAFEAAGAINFANQAMTNVDINGGAVDGTIIGAASQAAISATTLSASSTLSAGGNANLQGTLDVEGNAELHSDLTVGGTISGSTLHARNAVFGGTDQDHVAVTGSFSLHNELYGYDALLWDADDDSLQINAWTYMNGTVTLGDSTSDTVSFGGRIATDIVPSSDSARDLGTSALQWAELHVDTGHIDQLGSALDANNQAITNINVDGGAIDGTNVTVGSGKTLDVSGGTLTLAANQISGDKVEGGTIAAITISDLTTAGITATANIDIGAYDLRASTLTADSMTATRVAFYGANGVLSGDSDMTFATDTLTVTKLGAFEAAGAINFANQDMTNVDVDSGAIDGTTIGASSAAAGTFTTLTANDQLVVAAGAAITGDTTDEVTLLVQGVGSQTAALFQVKDSDGNADLAVAADGAVTFSGTATATEFVATSDARLKSNIQGVTNAMDVINSIQGVEYDLNETGQHSMGVLAQDLIEVAPSLVKTRENGNYAVNYSGLSAFFVEAIKEQQVQIEDLKNTVKELSK